MGKKTAAERAEAHAKHLQRRTAKAAAKGIDPCSLSDEMVLAAAQHAFGKNPEEAAKKAGLSVDVITKIANGRFTAEGEQVKAIVKAATAMGWQP